MDFNKLLNKGKQTALKTKIRKKKRSQGVILITFEAEEILRAEAMKKIPNLSDYLRRCLIRLVHSDVDTKIEEAYDSVIDEALTSLDRTTDRPPPTTEEDDAENLEEEEI